MLKDEPTRDIIFPFLKKTENYWIAKGLIPLGSKQPYFKYINNDGDINYKKMVDETISIPFDSINVKKNMRKASNILILGGMGDGKSQIAKMIWYILQKAGYKNLYFDPKESQDAAKGKIKWQGKNKLPSGLVPEGIPLYQLFPAWSIEAYSEHRKEQFYSLDMSEIITKEMWMGLGASLAGAGNIVVAIKELRKHKMEVNFSSVSAFLSERLAQDKIFTQTHRSAISALEMLQFNDIINSKYPSFNLGKYWKDKNSIVIGYDRKKVGEMTFDVGYCTQKAIDYANEQNKKGKNTAVMVYYDDAANFAKRTEYISAPYSVDKIKDLAFHARSLGVAMTLMVQGLGIIDENAAEGFSYKIISPKFEGIDGLSKLQIPHEVIYALRNNELVKKGSPHYLYEFQLVDSDKNVSRFFPYTPPPNHFTEVSP